MAECDGRIELDLELVGEAPRPLLFGLEAGDDRVGVLEVVGTGVTAYGVVAASDVAAGEADAQVHPAQTERNALFAPSAPCCHRPDLVEVPAGAVRDRVHDHHLTCRADRTTTVVGVGSDVGHSGDEGAVAGPLGRDEIGDAGASQLSEMLVGVHEGDDPGTGIELVGQRGDALGELEVVVGHDDGCGTAHSGAFEQVGLGGVTS